MASQFVARALVRTYSLDVDERLPPGQPSHELSKTLAYQRQDLEHIKQPWRCFFEPNDPFDSQRNTVAQTVAIEANKLREKWSVFHNKCSTEEKLDINVFEPTIEGATAAIEQCMELWKKRRLKGLRGNTDSNFHKVCKTLDSHNNVLAVLPQSSQYVSIFTGTLTTIVQASVNHERVIEGLSQGLSEIGESISDCTCELQLFRTEEMQKRISAMYAHIFIFFSSVMDWMMKKKRRHVLDAFNQNFMDRFQHDIDAIKSQAENVRHLGEQASRGELRATRLVTEESFHGLRSDLRVGLEGIARTHAESAYHNQLLELELMAEKKWRENIAQGVGFLTSFVSDIVEGRLGQPAQLSLLSLNRSPLLLSVASSHQDTPKEWMAEEVLENSRYCEEYFHRDRVRLPVKDTESVTVPREILEHLIEWTGPSPNSCVGLHGEYSNANDRENTLSLFAAQFILLLDRIRLPVISYFCELRRGERLRSGNKSIERQGIISLGYAVLRQMIELLLRKFTATVDLSETSFARLDGTKDSWNNLLELIGGLIPLMPSTVYVIIDGMHWLDDRTANPMARQLISCLRTTEGRLRLLFTTNGRCEVLLEQLNSNECVFVDDDMFEGYGVVLDRSSFLGVS